jgi:hypothetical protein
LPVKGIEALAQIGAGWGTVFKQDLARLAAGIQFIPAGQLPLDFSSGPDGSVIDLGLGA